MQRMSSQIPTRNDSASVVSSASHYSSINNTHNNPNTPSSNPNEIFRYRNKRRDDAIRKKVEQEVSTLFCLLSCLACFFFSFCGPFIYIHSLKRRSLYFQLIIKLMFIFVIALSKNLFQKK